MVKKLLLILLIAGSVAGQTNPQLDSISAAVRQQVGDVSSTSISQEVNRAYQQVTASYPAYEKWDTVLIDSASGRVILASDFDRIIGVDLINADEENPKARFPLRSLALIPRVPDTIRANLLRAEMDETDETDQKYFEVAARYLHTYPRWRRSDTAQFEVRYWARGAKLVADTNTITVESAYYNAVFYLACAEYQSRRGQFAEATYYISLCERMFGPLVRRRDEE